MEEVAPVSTPSNKAYVTFTSESNDGKKGFRIMFNSSTEGENSDRADSSQQTVPQVVEIDWLCWFV